MAVLVAGCLAMSMGLLSNQNDYSVTVSSSGNVTLGTGRYVKVNTWTSGTSCATLKVAYTDGTSTYESDALVAAGISELTPFYYKSHGLPEREFAIAYTVTGSGSCTIAFNARVSTPETLSCVLDADLMVQLQGSGAVEGRNDSLPRHEQRMYVRESMTIPNNNSMVSVAEANANVKFFNLGSGPQVQIGCIQVYTTPSQYYTASENPTCRAEQSSTDAMYDSSTQNIYLKDAYDCNAFTDASMGDILAVGLFGDTAEARDVYGQCCSKTNAADCYSLWAPDLSGGVSRACFWAESTTTCYPEYSAKFVDVTGIVGVKDTVTFASPEVYSPRSTYVSNSESLGDGFQGVAARRWWLMVENNIATTFPTECGLTATVSYVSTTTGGQCEPSSRRLCDNSHSACTAAPLTGTTPVFWESWKDGAVAITDDKFHLCNCLKEKEVCYRKGGCTSTKKYQLILQNCLDQGCGNYCNSGAGVVASLVMSVLAVLVVML
eukprot:TRINITY_DN349_c0_g1_i1.p1 TRINITY_DN349_c0_g1~~TRINITY_DN349_c0_g1_i1.p1  ORF type:complete len:492 (+),score=142.30 TRINITY_DN349_c0_g1_i1:53-1528(+)